MRARLWVGCAVVWWALLPGVASAANPAKVGTTVGQLVDGKAVQLGFSMSDPRVAATRSAISAEAHSLLEDVVGQTELSSITAATEEALATTAAATSWAGTALFAGVGALLASLPQPLADGSVDQWTVNSDGSLTISGNPHVAGGSVSPSWGGLTAGQTGFWSECQSEGQGCIEGASPEAAAQGYAQTFSGYTFESCAAPVNGVAVCTIKYPANLGGGTENVNIYYWSSSYTGSTCASGMAQSGSCEAYTPPAPAPVQTQTVPLDQAIADLPASDQALPVGSPWMADLTDALWQDAASQPGYQGLPYPADNPVSSGDAGTIQSSSPSTYPNVGDLVAPGADGSSAGSGTSPVSSPYGLTDPAAASSPAATNPGSGAQVNLGPDPGIGSPTLESTPTAAQILAPLLNLLPDFRGFAVPAHTGTCPQPSFSWAGSTYTWTKHCELIEQNRSLITQSFVVAFSLAAVLIVLTA